MKKLILLFFLLISTAQAQWFTNSESGSSRSEAATFYDQIMISSNVSPWRIKQVSSDPSSVATFGNTGDLASHSPTGLYIKADIGTTVGWSQIGTFDPVVGTPAGVFFANALGSPTTDASQFAFDSSTGTVSASGGYDSGDFTGGLILVSVGAHIGEATPLIGNQFYTGANITPTSIQGGGGVVILSDTTSGGTTITISSSGTGHPSCYVSDTKPNNTDGGGITLGAFRQRDINTISGAGCFDVSVVDNQFIISTSGIWDMDGDCPVVQVNQHAMRIANSTTGALVIPGTTENANFTNGVSNRSFVAGSVITTVSTTFQLEHYSTGTKSGNGLGDGFNNGQVEVFCKLKVTRVD